MAIPKIATQGTETLQHRRRVAESLNNIIDFSYDDSRVRTKAEAAVGVTPTNYAYPPGDLRRYGAALDGATNDISAWDQCLLANGFVLPWVGTSKISSTLTLPSEGCFIGGFGEVSYLHYTGSAVGIDFNAQDYCEISRIKLWAPSATKAIYAGNIAHWGKVGDCDIRGSSTGNNVSGTPSTGVGIEIERSFYFEVAGNDINAFAKGVYGTHEFNGNFVINNSIRRCKRGIHIDSTSGNSDGNSILANEIESSVTGDLYGIDIENASSTMIAHNRIEYSASGSVSIYVHGTGGGTTATRNSLVDNHCVGTEPSVKIGDDSGANKVSLTNLQGGYYGGTITIGVDADYSAVDLPLGRYIIAGSGGVGANLINNSTTSTISIREDQTTTLTLTGCTTSPTGDIVWTLNKGVVTLYLPTIQGTSNTTAATLGTLPAMIRPQATRNVMWRITDNSVAVTGMLSISTAGVLTLSNAVDGAGSMTNGGTKGVLSGTITYPIA